MPRRLIWFGGVSLAYLAICFAAHLILHKSTLELYSYRTMVASISGRIHEPMSQGEVEHLSSQVSKIEFGGDLRSLGLGFEPEPLIFYLSPATFDMSASLTLLVDGRLRASQVKFDSLSSKIDTVYARRTQLLNTLSTLAAVVGLGLLLMFIWLWRQSTGHWSNEISAVDEATEEAWLNFNDYLQSVVREEVKFIKHRAALSCKGFEASEIPAELKETLELIAEQLVRNSVEHGGRPAEVRLLAGKADHILVSVALEEQENSWLLSVRDNGEGIDGNGVLRKALNLKLISQASASSLAVEQRVKLIFLSGFTTRETSVSSAENDLPLSELRAISKLFGGVISIQNKPGEYCQFSVRFPKV